METVRKKFQGVGNILRFNWHFYALLAAILTVLLGITIYCPSSVNTKIYIASALLVLSAILSLFVSYYVYDASGFYEFRWLKDEIGGNERRIANIHAGFDETSAILDNLFPDAELAVFDFYDPTCHTEISIERARRAYAPYPGTKAIDTGRFPEPTDSKDMIFLILAAHEIRQEAERIIFFREIHRVLKADGRVFIVEHLRDLPNFLAYTVGAFHFHSRQTWKKTFSRSGLMITGEKKINRLITLFILSKHDTSY